MAKYGAQPSHIIIIIIIITMYFQPLDEKMRQPVSLGCLDGKKEGRSGMRVARLDRRMAPKKTSLKGG